MTRLRFVALVVALTTAGPPAQTVLAVGRTVGDLEASIAFYRDVLDFRIVATRDEEGPEAERRHGVFAMRARTAVLQLGDERVELTEFLTPRGRPIPADARSNDRWFQHLAIVVRDMDAAYAALVRHRVRHASPRPQTLPACNPVAGGIRAFYFHDPDGHPLEILWFPPDKGDPRWHRPGADLFLGIDHTAIVVADTATSLRFWRDEVGLRVVGRSENVGVEQARLNCVEGAHLMITTLRGEAGPGVELLEYVAPRSGRAMPADTAATDRWHQFVVLRLPPAAGAPLPLRTLDHDGHRVLLLQ